MPNRSITDPRTRFWEKVDKRGPEECWLWTAAKHEFGYGVLGAGGQGTTNIRAHRLSWEMANGPIPDGLQVLHRCDVPACVNPAHLFLGTNADNTADKVAKNRQGAPSGEANAQSKLSDAQREEIRRLYVPGQFGFKRLGKLFGVDPNTIRYVVTGKGSHADQKRRRAQKEVSS